MNKEEILEEFDRVSTEIPGFIKETGMKLTEIGEGYGKGRVYIEEKHNNPMGTVHGGMIFSLADTVAGRTAMVGGSKVVTLNANISYLNPAYNTEYIEAIANVVRDGKTTAVYDVMIKTAEGVDVAKVLITYYKM